MDDDRKNGFSQCTPQKSTDKSTSFCEKVLGLMFLIIIECYITAIFAPDFTGRLICMGVAIQLTLQTFINVGVATEILPNTGIPLPFISSGLSSLISILGGFGFVFNVGLQRVRQ